MAELGIGPTKAKETQGIRHRQYYPVGMFRERASDAQNKLILTKQ